MKNSVATLIHFVRELKVPVMPESVEQELTLHPNYLSLFSLSDVLNTWSIPNISYKINKEDLVKVPCPFITVNNKEEFLLVHDMDETQVIVSNEKWQKHTLDIEAFFELYGGIVLVAEPDDESGEENYYKKRRQKLIAGVRNPLVLLGLLITISIAISIHSSYAAIFNWQTALLALFKSVGLITSVFLLMHSIDADNPIVQRLCTGLKSNCNSILSSKAAKITDELSWAEAGFFYFAGTWLVLLFNTNSIVIMQLLAVLNLLTLPYTFYSVYYQSMVVKQWCVFCCTVLALFWLEFSVFLPYLLQPFKIPGGNDWGTLLIGMAFPILLWVFIKPLLLKSKQLDPVIQQLNSLKYNPAVITSIFNSEQEYPLLNEELTIIIGNPDAKNIITIVANPYCSPCALAHKTLDKWIETRDDVKLQLVFYAPTENNYIWRLANHWLALKNQKGNIQLKQAIDDWFAQKQINYYKWVEAYPVNDDDSTQKIIDKQKQWCKTTGIKSTPTLFINGRKLPAVYSVKDIKHFD